MDLGSAFLYLLTPAAFGWCVLGVVLGIMVGAVPGLSAGMLIALTLPLTFYMESKPALVLLIAMYVGGVTGGLISATLLRIPGTAASIMTTFDGYPMARGGQPGRALGFGIFASFVGGCISWIVLATISEPLSRFALRFGPFDYFAMVMMAMAIIASVGQGSLLKAMLSGFLGIMIALPGQDPGDGSYRLTFGFSDLAAGFGLLPVLLGVFAVSQVIKDMVEIDLPMERLKVSMRGAMLPVRDMGRQAVNALRSSIIGTWVGILPGIGANVGSIVAYTVARNVSRTPMRFGKGSEEGIVASESANNATVGGALVPLIALGIPGSVIDAILLGALAIHNVQAGPMLFRSNPDIVYTIIATALVANVVMLVVMAGATGWIARVIYVPRQYLMPAILVFCILGCFALNNRMFDVWVMLGFGVLGYLLERASIPMGPLVIGLVLAPIAEANLRSGLMASAGSYAPLVTNAFPLICLIVSVATLAWPFVSAARRSARPKQGELE